jgi:hypothetical protein
VLVGNEVLRLWDCRREMHEREREKRGDHRREMHGGKKRKYKCRECVSEEQPKMSTHWH